jgi:hypothetical protein
MITKAMNDLDALLDAKDKIASTYGEAGIERR